MAHDLKKVSSCACPTRKDGCRLRQAVNKSGGTAFSSLGAQQTGPPLGHSGDSRQEEVESCRSVALNHTILKVTQQPKNRLVCSLLLDIKMRSRLDRHITSSSHTTSSCRAKSTWHITHWTPILHGRRSLHGRCRTAPPLS